ncbi:MAG: hypothetical protein ABIF87_05205 [Pseudomonadota bacterium]
MLEFIVALPIGAVFGWVIREIVSDRLARDRTLKTIKINDFNKTANKLRESFLPIRMALNPAKFALQEDLADFLGSHFEDNGRCVLEFSDVLDTKSKTAFLKAWHEYHCHKDQCNEKGVPFFEQYSCRGLTIEQEHEMKKLVQSRIEKILKFAKPK